MKKRIFSLIALLLIDSQAHASIELSNLEANRIVDAIYQAEGGRKAIKPFGVLSIPCKSYEGCRKIALNTVKNNHKRWRKSGAKGDYLEFLAKRYAPLKAKNDPKNLNKNWLRNVRHHLKKQKH